MVYPKQFKERVKGRLSVSIYNGEKLMDALNTGSPMVGYYLSEMSNSIFQKVLECNSSVGIEIISFEEKKTYSLFKEWLNLFNEQYAA